MIEKLLGHSVPPFILVFFAHHPMGREKIPRYNNYSKPLQSTANFALGYLYLATFIRTREKYGGAFMSPLATCICVELLPLLAKVLDGRDRDYPSPALAQLRDLRPAFSITKQLSVHRAAL